MDKVISERTMIQTYQSQKSCLVGNCRVPSNSIETICSPNMGPLPQALVARVFMQSENLVMQLEVKIENMQVCGITVSASVSGNCQGTVRSRRRMMRNCSLMGSVR